MVSTSIDRSISLSSDINSSLGSYRRYIHRGNTAGEVCHIQNYIISDSSSCGDGSRSTTQIIAYILAVCNCCTIIVTISQLLSLITAKLNIECTISIGRKCILNNGSTKLKISLIGIINGNIAYLASGKYQSIIVIENSVQAVRNTVFFTYLQGQSSIRRINGNSVITITQINNGSAASTSTNTYDIIGVLFATQSNISILYSSFDACISCLGSINNHIAVAISIEYQIVSTSGIVDISIAYSSYIIIFLIWSNNTKLICIVCYIASNGSRTYSQSTIGSHSTNSRSSCNGNLIALSVVVIKNRGFNSIRF